MPGFDSAHDFLMGKRTDPEATLEPSMHQHWSCTGWSQHLAKDVAFASGTISYFNLDMGIAATGINEM